MKKKHLAMRLDELERRVRELEARPLPALAPITGSPAPTIIPLGPAWWTPILSPGGTGQCPEVLPGSICFTMTLPGGH